MKAAAHIALFCTAFLTLMPAANAEPSAAYLKCMKLLNGKAEAHLEKADNLRRKFEADINKLVRNAVKNNAGLGSSEQQLRESVERIKKWHSADEKRYVYVERAITILSQPPADDGPSASCIDHSSLSRAYKRYIEGYDFVLRLVLDDTRERLLLEELGDDEGLVVIAFNSEEPDLRVLLNRKGGAFGNIEFTPARPGEHFRVVRAKAGTYYWDRINQVQYPYKRWYELEHFDFEFVVEAGKLNYAGVFMFEVAKRRYAVSLKDRLVITLAVLGQRYPELIDRYEIANGLNPDDRFTEYYLSEKRLASAASSVDSSE